MRQELKSIGPLMDLSMKWSSGLWPLDGDYWLDNVRGKPSLTRTKPEKAFGKILNVESLDLVGEVTEPTIAISWPAGETALFIPEGWDELEGRQFEVGVSDCYVLLRDYYKRALGIEMQEASMALSKLTHSGNIPSDRFWSHPEVANWNRVIAPRVNDAVYMAFGPLDVPNHCGVLLENGMILHHFANRLSCIEPYTGVWKEKTIAFMRHKSLG